MEWQIYLALLGCHGLRTWWTYIYVYLNTFLSQGSEVCALYPPVKEKVHCSAPNSVKKLVLHRIQWQIQHWFFHSAEKSIFFNDYFITEFGDDLLATNSSLNPVMKISLISFVNFWVTEFSAYVCTEVDENDFGQDFSTEFSEKLCASLNSMTN